MNGTIDPIEATMFTSPILPDFNSNSQIIDVLTDNRHYNGMREIVSENEDEEGNYDYSQVSNVGMVYLYVHNREKTRKPRTKEDYARLLLAFLQYAAIVGKSDIRQLSRYDMEAFQIHLEEQHTKSSTLSKKVVIVHSFLTWCYEEGYLKKNIARGLRPVKLLKEEIPERDIDELDLKEAVAFYEHNPKVQSLVLLLATSGMRLNEVITPSWQDLYWDRRQKKHYLITRTKRDKIRHVHIKDYVLQVLLEYRKRIGLSTELNGEDTTPFYPNRFGKRYTLSSLSTYLSKYIADAGLTTIHGNRVTPHFLRHYFAQTAYAKGAPLDWISETVDHSSTKITKDNYLSRQLKKDRDVSDYVDLEW